MNLDDVVTQVAAAVGLAERESGIRDILAAVLSAEPAAVRDVARLAELPVPIVAAACNELRRRGVIDAQRPVRLTAGGRLAVAAAAGGPPLRAACPDCAGRGGVIPPEMARLSAAPQASAGRPPGPQAAPHQTHCPGSPKSRRP